MSEASANPESAAAPRDPRTRIIDALMELAAERQWEDITLSELAERAGVSLSQFRD
jgi:AcrR family transcriptional regulator